MCSLAKAVDIVGERWVFFIVREALAGVTRFAEFRSRLGIAPDRLSQRLSLLVDTGILERRAYKEPGDRERMEYVLTESGRELALPVFALQQWGDKHTPSTLDGSIAFIAPDGSPVSVTFVTETTGAYLPEVKAYRVSDRA